MRVIAGSERGRTLRVPRGRSVRPTPDRVRETLFNWLQGELEGSEVLDLFAGSGALGLEALSRGAAHATFVETASGALEALRANLEPFAQSERAELVRTSAWGLLEKAPRRSYHLVFLDPPYGRDWGPRAAHRLEEWGWLAPGAWVYLETASGEGEPQVPTGWRLHRSGTCGDVASWLYERPDPQEGREANP